MKPERTADDKVLSLLALQGKALEREEIARALNWSKQRAAIVLLRLATIGKIAVTPGEVRQNEPGRPPALYSLPAHAPAAATASKPLIFQPDTIVVTPSDREARVIRMNGEFVEIEYLRVRLGHEPRATVRATLLRAFQAGRDRPEPVRVHTVPDPTTA